MRRFDLKRRTNMAELFNTTSFRLLEQGLTALKMQQDVIAQNIANQDTPDYSCKYLTFEGVLRDVIDTNAKYKKTLELQTNLYIDENTNDQPDGNNVDNDTQQALLAKNQLYYDAIINQMNSEFNMMRTAMSKN